MPHAIRTRLLGGAGLLFALVVSAPRLLTAQLSHYDFVGSAHILNDPSDPSGGTLLLDFIATVGSVGHVTSVPNVSGVFAPIGLFQPGTIQDIRVSATSVGRVTSAPSMTVEPFLTTGGFSFTLDEARSGSTFGPISLVAAGTGTTGSFGISGRYFGTASGMYTGMFTADFDGLSPTEVFNRINSGLDFNEVAFQAAFVASVVPEPVVLMLVGPGLLALAGLAHARRRRHRDA